MNPHTRSHLAVLAAIIVATLAVTFPLVIGFRNGIPYGGDSFQFVWNGWWFSKAVTDPSLSLWFTPYQFAPQGASLALHDLSPINAVFQAMARGAIGDFAAYNFLIIFHYILGAWGAYILAWYLTGNRAGSVIAAFIYGFSAHHAMHLSQLSIVSTGWFPLSVYYLLKYTRDGGLRDGILSMVMLVASALSTWYHLVFAALVFFGFMFFGQIGMRESLGGTRRWMRAIMPWVGAGLIVSPLLYMGLVEAKKQMVEPLVQMGLHYYLDPAWLVLPPPTHPALGVFSKPFLQTIPGNTTEGVASLGLVAIVLGFLSWFRKTPTTRAWCWLGLVLFLLALGQTITILGISTHIPGPFRLWSMIPILNLVRVPARFVGPFTLVLGLGAAGWVAGLGTTWLRGTRRFILLWVLPFVILFETLVAPIPIKGLELYHPKLKELASIYQQATGDPNPPDLIANFPVFPERRQFLYQQTLHELPTVDCELSNPPAGARDYLRGFNWNPDNLKALGVDMFLYQPWAAKTSLGETFQLDYSEGIPLEFRGKAVEPLVFFRDVKKCRIIYQDERLIVFLP